jgi:hypothetical protein
MSRQMTARTVSVLGFGPRLHYLLWTVRYECRRFRRRVLARIFACRASAIQRRHFATSIRLRSGIRCSAKKGSPESAVAPDVNRALLDSGYENQLGRNLARKGALQMKQTFTVALLALSLFLFVGCRGDGGRSANAVARLWQNADKGRRAAVVSAEQARQARVARQFQKAAELSDDASRHARDVAAAAQESEQIKHGGHLSEQSRNLLDRIAEADVQAQFARLQTQADDAVETTALRMKTETGGLANHDIDAVRDFSRDCLCFYLETLAEKGRLPDDSEYEHFIRDHALTRLVPWWEIKGKAANVIAFAQDVATPRSAAELRARVMLLNECTFGKSRVQ